MPPKRKVGRPPRTAPSLSGNTTEDASGAKDTKSTPDNELQNHQDDPWTDEQEAALFKGIIRWKPVGFHKHFRMIALSQHLQQHGYTTSNEEHIRIPGIWNKLGRLYNLEALDERENSFTYAGSLDGDESEEVFYPFTLPKEDFGSMMFDRRLAPKGSTSPPASTRPPSAGSISATATRRASTVEDTEDPRSSPASFRDTRAIRSSRGTRTTRRSQLHEVFSLPEQRRGSKASLDESSVDARHEEAADAPEEPEDGEQTAPDGESKPSNARDARRRSGRRR